MEIGIAGIDPPDTVLPHQDGSVSIVDDISANLWHLLQHLFDNARVALRLYENTQCGRSEHGFHKRP